MNKNKFPDFFIIGMQKSGTSTLHGLLSLDKRISLPYRKETHFFSTNYSKGISWYLNQFKQSSYCIRGEVDPSYIFLPDSLYNIKKHIANPKFIIILRKPLDRSFSHYLMSKQRGYETLSFNEALFEENQRIENDINNFSLSNHSYLLRSDYIKLIKNLNHLFSESSILYLKFDDLLLLETRIEMFKKIYSFLGIPYISYVNKYNIHNNKSSTYRFKYLNKLLYTENLLRDIFKSIIPTEYIRYYLFKFLTSINSKAIIKNDNYLNNIDSKFIKWNNNQCKLLKDKLNFNIEEWEIK